VGGSDWTGRVAFTLGSSSMADNNTIEVVGKTSGEKTSVSSAGPIMLAESSVVKLPYGPEEIASITQEGMDLVVVLKSGERIVIGNFFVAEGEDGNQLVLEDSNGVLWLGQYDAPWTAGSQFAFAEISDLMLAAGGGLSNGALWALGLLGA